MVGRTSLWGARPATDRGRGSGRGSFEATNLVDLRLFLLSALAVRFFSSQFLPLGLLCELKDTDPTHSPVPPAGASTTLDVFDDF